MMGSQDHVFWRASCIQRYLVPQMCRILTGRRILPCMRHAIQRGQGACGQGLGASLMCKDVCIVMLRRVLVCQESGRYLASLG
jgi:hypothetical protein